MFGFGILTGLILLPLIGAAFILILRGEDEATLRNARSGQPSSPSCSRSLLGRSLIRLQPASNWWKAKAG